MSIGSIATYLETLPNYIAYFIAQIVLVGAFLGIYAMVTPYREVGLIRAGNSAAAIAMVGTVCGFSLALNSIAAHSGSVLDLVVWGVVALGSQVLAYLGVTLLLPGFRAGIEAGKLAYGITLGGLSVAMGLINAGSLTY